MDDRSRGILLSGIGSILNNEQGSRIPNQKVK